MRVRVVLGLGLFMAISLGFGFDTITKAEKGAASSGSMDAGTYSVRLRDLEQRVTELKEQIFRSKARLSLLAESVLDPRGGVSQAIILHENDISKAFRLVRAEYRLDGTPIFSQNDTSGAFHSEKEIEIYKGGISAGPHVLEIKLEYVGNGRGLFSYLKGYHYTVEATHAFSAVPDQYFMVRAIGYDKGGRSAKMEDRPAVRFVERVSQITRGKELKNEAE